MSEEERQFRLPPGKPPVPTKASAEFRARETGIEISTQLQSRHAKIWVAARAVKNT
jgi:hypothetical protein